MINSITRNIKSLINWLGLGITLLIIGMVILIFLGRQTIGSLDQMRPNIQQFIASSIGMEVNLGELKGEWPQLIPIVDIANIEIVDTNQNIIIGLQDARADLDLFSTLRHRTPIWRELFIDKLEVSFIEDASGHWHLQGFGGQSESDLDIIVQPFLFSRLIRLNSLAINLHSFSGKTVSIFGEEMLIENDRDFHRAQFSLSLSERDVPAYMILEAYGNPIDLESFSANGYIKFEQFNLSEPLLAITRSLMPELFDNLSQTPIETGGEIWLDIYPGGGLDYEGLVSVSEVPLDWLVDVPPISFVETLLTGWHTPGKDWGVRLQDLQFDWSGTRIDPVDMVFTQHLGSSWQEFDLSFSHVDLMILDRLLGGEDIAQTKIPKILSKMGPSGNLSSLSVGKNQQGYYVSANLEGFSSSPYAGIPGLKDIHGYLELRGSEGLFHIADSDGFEIYFPKTYRDYLTIDRAQGTVYFNWQSDDKLLVYSDPIYAVTKAGESKTLFSIEKSRNVKQQAPEFNLVIGGSNLDLAQISTFLPYTMKKSSADWLKRAIKGGFLREFGFLFRGGPPKSNRLSRTSQLLFDAERTAIKFNPDWPQLTEIDGLFVIDDGAVSAQISSALLVDAEVVDTRIEYSVSKPIEQRRWLVDGKLHADLSEVMDVLADSPLRAKLGPMVDWRYTGKTEAKINLEIPANRVDKTSVVGNYTVATAVDNGEIAIADSPVVLENFSGSIGFSSDSGLYADDLTATLWQQPLKAKIFKSDRQQKLSFVTSLAPTDLNRFVNFPWQDIISGLVPIEGMLTIDPQSLESAVKLNLISTMQGVEVNIPAPLGKASQQSKLLDINLYFDPRISRLQGNFGDLLSTDLYFSQGNLQKGLLSYDRSVDLPDKGILLVSAYLPTSDLSVWKPLTELVSKSNKSTKPWRTVFDLQFDRMNFATMNFEAIKAQVEALESGLKVDFTSNLADGDVLLPWTNNQPPKVDLTRLQLPAMVIEKSSAIDPRQLKAVDLSVDQFSIGSKHIGSLSFKLRPEPSGVTFNNISGKFFGLRSGVFEAEAPMDFFWGFDGNNHLSKLVGPVAIDNIGDLFNHFDMPRVLDSESGKLYMDLSWQGKPWSVNKENLQGDFRVSLRDGSFYRTPGGAGAALKVVSLFNFANWLRRLQLDFSDVVGQDLSYNSLDGTLNFKKGTFSLDEPLKMHMPSGRMSMSGNFDLLEETVDAQLIATLPVVANLPWLVGLTGGLPAAVGVYVTSKLMEKQVDRLSSISYNLSGSWEQVEVSVNEIFAAELPDSDRDQDTDQ
jgi:uncharacterized protein (TIGR02099 family)